MSIEKNIGFSGMKPAIPVEGLQKGTAGTGSLGRSSDSALSDEFRRSLDQALGSRAADGASVPSQAGQVRGPAPIAAASNLKFSNHAIERMHSRGISIGADEMKSIESAISRAAQKGSKDALVLAGDKALIVSVKNNTVVTVMDKAAMKENVFTNIDSTVVI